MLFGLDEASPGESAGMPGPSNLFPPPVPPRGSDRWFYGLVGLLLGIVLALVVWLMRPDAPENMTPAEVNTAIVEAMAAIPAPVTGPEAYNQVAPSLVVVRAFGDADGSTGQGASGANIGGGVVINERGQILTANHVVEGAASIEVVFANGSTATAVIVNNTAEDDIAVLEAIGSTGPLTPAVMGNPRTMQVGDPIFAVGNPLGLTQSLSAGVVSGLNRNIPLPGEGERVLQGLIQFDAAVNQGNSGGPLLNSEGHVVGIVTALADPALQGYFIGIGFAVPIDIATGGAVDGPSQ